MTMRVALICIDKPDALQIRLDNRAAHLAYIQATGVVEMAGPFLDAAGADVRHRLIIWTSPPWPRREAWAASDPYAKAGLFDSRHGPGMEEGDRLMAYWLFKSEPDVWGWDHQVAKGDVGEEWHGRAQLSGPQQHARDEGGRPGFFYHSNVGKEIVGIVEVIRGKRPDSTTDDPRWDCVRIRARAALDARHPGRMQGHAGAGADGSGQQHPALGAARDAGGMADHLPPGRRRSLRGAGAPHSKTLN